MSPLNRVVRTLEWPMAVLALLVIPALVIEDRAVRPETRAVGVVLNWVIWLAFCAEFLVRWAADGRRSFPGRHWFDLLLIVVTPPFAVPDALQGVRSLRVLRLFRLLRAFGVATMAFRLAQRHFGRQKFHYVMLIAVATVVFGALGLYLVESGSNPNVTHFGDALWWAASTVTTVGYGDIVPTSGEGRLIAALLMVTGIGAIGVFTATVASFLFEREQESDSTALETRLAAIERKLDELIHDRRTGNRPQDLT